MACCDCKQGTAKCLVLIFTIIFGLGVTISTLSPNWIHFSAIDAAGSHDVEMGPFYGQYRTCESLEDGSNTCSSWESKSINLSDCDSVGESANKTLCNHLATWRVTGMLCLIAMLIGGGLVLAASCCQMVTCGCCGNSLTCIANVLFWIEVVLSIVTWSFTISSLTRIEQSGLVTSTGYQWGFWMFIFSGTIMAALSAWMADWAAEDSALRGIWHCITCRSCRNRNRDNDDNDDRGDPLLGA